MQVTDEPLRLDEIHPLLDRLCPEDELEYLQANPWLYDTMANYLVEQCQGTATLAECRQAVVSYIQLQQAKRRKRNVATLAILRRNV